MAEWKKYTGTPEQIDELRNAENGFVCRNDDVESGILTIKYGQLFSDQQKQPILDAMFKDSIQNFLNKYKTKAFWLIHDDPLREMKIRWAMTAQRVFVRIHHANDVIDVFYDQSPNWNIPNAEYRFSPFEY